MDTSQTITIRNEFASVEIRVQQQGNGMQALVTDRRSGAARGVDVLALEGLAWAPEWLIACLADPALPEHTEDKPRQYDSMLPPNGRDGSA